MRKEKTNKGKLALVEKKIVDKEIKEEIGNIDNWKLRIVTEKIKEELKLL